MIARGKSRLVGTSPLGNVIETRTSPERAEYFVGPSGLDELGRLQPGATRSASLRACPWLSYFAPVALYSLNANSAKGAEYYFGPSGLDALARLQPGATRSASLALAPGSHISRRWRSVQTFEAKLWK